MKLFQYRRIVDLCDEVVRLDAAVTLPNADFTHLLYQLQEHDIDGRATAQALIGVISALEAMDRRP